MDEDQILEIKAAFEKNAAVNAAALKRLEEKSDAALLMAEKSRAEQIELEQEISEKLARGMGRTESKSDALASQLIANANWMAVASKSLPTTSLQIKSSDLLLEQKSTVSYDAGGLRVAQNVGIVTGMERRRFLADKLIQLPVIGGSVEYSKETMTNNADVQGGGSPFEHEGVLKPESDFTYALTDVKIPTIAHTVVCSNQILSDVAGLQQLLENRLRYGLRIKLDQQLVAGTGVGAQMSGLTKAGNYTAFTPTSGETGIDSINRALGVLEVNEAVGNLVLLNPTDYRALQRVKGGLTGDYLFGQPGGSNSESIWNVEVLPCNAVSSGYFIACDTSQLGILYTRQDAQIATGWVGNQFAQNLCTIRAEMRAVLAVQRAQAVVYGALSL